MSFNRHLQTDGHVHRFVVTLDQDGWDVREEEDSAIVTRVHRSDWHRVETHLQLFELKAREVAREARR